MKLLFLEAQNLVHDASGLSDPNLYWWEIDRNGVCYPVSKITESELHAAIQMWIEHEKLPNLSLDELPIHHLTYSQRIVRDWFLNHYHKMF